MEYSTAVITALVLLCLALLALMYCFLLRVCRRKEMNLQEAQSDDKPGSDDMDSQAAKATPQLCTYEKRRFFASFPSLDRLLCQTITCHEGVTLESDLANLSSRSGGRTNSTTEEQQRQAEAQTQESNSQNKIKKDLNIPSEEDCGPGKTIQPCGTSAATQTRSGRVHSSMGILAHSILNMVSSIPSVSLAAFSYSQSLPNVHGCLAESVSTSSGSRDLVGLWSTTLESNDAGILTSTHLE